MTLLTKEDRENLLTEYKQLHDENWRRGNAIWIVNSILITGSLLVAFQSNISNFPAPLASLLLVIIALISTATGNHVTGITYQKIAEIRKKVGMTESTKMYQLKIQGKPWHILRTNAAYLLFISLIGTYIQLLLEDYYLSLALILFGIILLVIKEVYLHLERTKEDKKLSR